MWQTHKSQIANFDMASLRVIWFRWAGFWVARPGDGSTQPPNLFDEMLLPKTVLSCWIFSMFAFAAGGVPYKIKQGGGEFEPAIDYLGHRGKGMAAVSQAAASVPASG